MRKNIGKVIEAYKLRKTARGDSNGSCSTDGERIYSYAMVIAERLPDGTTRFATEDGCSRTTASQIRAVRLALA